MNNARETLERLPCSRLADYPTAVDTLDRLRAALGRGPRILAKRDDAIGFAFGGNKVRKIELVAAEAVAAGADSLVTAGGIQSNHARVTAAAAARLGMKCVLVVNGSPPTQPTANALLDRLLGAEIEHVPSRDERGPAMQTIAERLRAEGLRPFVIPVGASTPLGALAYARAVGELARQIPPPDAIVHATSSGGTQAGLVLGCALYEWPSRVIGISADDPAPAIRAQVTRLLEGATERLGIGTPRQWTVEVDDGFVGSGYGERTPASEEATLLVARTEALFLDPTYTAKAMAGLIARVRDGRFRDEDTVLFWHTGGQVGLFA